MRDELLHPLEVIRCFDRSCFLLFSTYCNRFKRPNRRWDIIGTVLDTAGAVIPGVQVTIRNQETGGERHLITDAARGL